jgi:hypothetical protein
MEMEEERRRRMAANSLAIAPPPPSTKLRQRSQLYCAQQTARLCLPCDLIVHAASTLTHERRSATAATPSCIYFLKKMAEKHQTKTYQQGGMVLLMLHANSMVLRNLQK